MVFLLDIFKQGMGQLLLHFINIFLAIFITSGHSTVDQCTMYFSVFILDLIPGLFFTIGISLLSDYIFKRCGCRNLVSGNYVYDNMGELGIRKCVYVAQIFIWATVITLSKLCTTFVGYFIKTPIEIFSSFVLKIVSFDNVSFKNINTFLELISYMHEINFLKLP